MVGERWRAAGQLPDTETLRSILHEQITGFDINEAALRFAARGLYLMSIELDANPEPIHKLRFNGLTLEIVDLQRLSRPTSSQNSATISSG